ncbi:hypothetical protein [Yinghuangia soli]|uniref:hypothetical protein n=1 Tax=Yinghuangia soli TaxID=2908204 RepID=UPI002285603E|nr:hypothetical protein [Yinghuangia soli]
MGSLVSELGKQLAEKWMSLLVLPGALYLAVATAAHTLGHSHALDAPMLSREVTAWAERPAAHTAGGQLVLLMAFLLAAAAVGAIAQAAGSFVERVALAQDWTQWPRPFHGFAQRRVTARKAKWTTHVADYRQARADAVAELRAGRRADRAARDAAYDRLTRTSQELPARPTWSGDRINAVSVRLDREHGLNLTAVWPYIWLTAPDTVRTETSTARQAIARATALSAWGVLYLLLTIWWWPAALVGAVLITAGWRRTRAATDLYAQLLEASIRVHAPELSRIMGLPAAEPFDLAAGVALTDHVILRPPPEALPSPAAPPPPVPAPAAASGAIPSPGPGSSPSPSPGTGTGSGSSSGPGPGPGSGSGSGSGQSGATP